MSGGIDLATAAPAAGAGAVTAVPPTLARGVIVSAADVFKPIPTAGWDTDRGGEDTTAKKTTYPDLLIARLQPKWLLFEDTFNATQTAATLNATSRASMDASFRDAAEQGYLIYLCPYMAGPYAPSWIGATHGGLPAVPKVTLPDNGYDVYLTWDATYLLDTARTIAKLRDYLLGSDGYGGRKLDHLLAITAGSGSMGENPEMIVKFGGANDQTALLAATGVTGGTTDEKLSSLRALYEQGQRAHIALWKAAFPDVHLIHYGGDVWSTNGTSDEQVATAKRLATGTPTTTLNTAIPSWPPAANEVKIDGDVKHWATKGAGQMLDHLGVLRTFYFTGKNAGTTPQKLTGVTSTTIPNGTQFDAGAVVTAGMLGTQPPVYDSQLHPGITNGQVDNTLTTYATASVRLSELLTLMRKRNRDVIFQAASNSVFAALNDPALAFERAMLDEGVGRYGAALIELGPSNVNANPDFVWNELQPRLVGRTPYFTRYDKRYVRAAVPGGHDRRIEPFARNLASAVVSPTAGDLWLVRFRGIPGTYTKFAMGFSIPPAGTGGESHFLVYNFYDNTLIYDSGDIGQLFVGGAAGDIQVTIPTLTLPYEGDYAAGFDKMAAYGTTQPTIVCGANQTTTPAANSKLQFRAPFTVAKHTASITTAGAVPNPVVPVDAAGGVVRFWFELLP